MGRLLRGRGLGRADAQGREIFGNAEARWALSRADRAEMSAGGWEMEIGFGRGDELLERARGNPEKKFIGVERYLSGVSRVYEALEREGLTNIRVFGDDAEKLVVELPENSVENVYILNPDPWPKYRHKKRIVIQQGFLQELKRVLRGGAGIYFSTDDCWLCAWTLRQMDAIGGICWEESAELSDKWGKTRYEAKAQRAGRTGVRLKFRYEGAEKEHGNE